jgi:hypothetical protein
MADAVGAKKLSYLAARGGYRHAVTHTAQRQSESVYVSFRAAKTKTVGQHKNIHKTLLLCFF